MIMELQVCHTVKSQYLQIDEYKLVEHGEGYLRYLECEMINYQNSQKKKSIRIRSGLVRL
jgi:hypothetical protein